MAHPLSILFSRSKRVFRQIGLKVDRATLRNDPELRLEVYLKHFGIDVLLDVGANDGSFVLELLKRDFRGRVISFEPLPEMWNQLRRKSSRWSNWEVAPRMALSSVPGEAEFHQAANDSSSSLLPMLDRHVQAAPATGLLKTFNVPTDTLDNMLVRLNISSDSKVMLKIDVQGAEDKVLAGAVGAISAGNICLIKVEMSLTDLYGGQPRWQELNANLEAAGYRLWDIEPGFRDPVTGELLQFDGLYTSGDV